jgi:hypothetical protein
MWRECPGVGVIRNTQFKSLQSGKMKKILPDAFFGVLNK